MARVKRGVATKRKHKKYISLGKGFKGRANRCYKVARRMGLRALQFQYVGRKHNKRNARRRFIAIINTFCRTMGSKYSLFINKFLASEFVTKLDRKAMALMIQHNPEEFKHLYNQIVKV